MLSAFFFFLYVTQTLVSQENSYAQCKAVKTILNTFIYRKTWPALILTKLLLFTVMNLWCDECCTLLKVYCVTVKAHRAQVTTDNWTNPTLCLDFISRVFSCRKFTAVPRQGKSIYNACRDFKKWSCQIALVATCPVLQPSAAVKNNPLKKRLPGRKVSLLRYLKNRIKCSAGILSSSRALYEDMAEHVHKVKGQTKGPERNHNMHWWGV